MLDNGSEEEIAMKKGEKVKGCLMVGYSPVLMEGVVKAMAIDNQWLFTEVEAADLVIGMHQYQ